MESMLSTATATEWSGPAAYTVPRLFEVRPTVGTEYYAGTARPQGPPHPDAWVKTGDDVWYQPRVHADLPGGGTQAFVPDHDGRDDWSVRAVARSEAEMANLPKTSVRGYGPDGDLLVTPPESHDADRLLKTHTAVDENPFAHLDEVAARRHPDHLKGALVDRFAGSIYQMEVGLPGGTPTTRK